MVLEGISVSLYVIFHVKHKLNSNSYNHDGVHPEVTSQTATVST